MISIKKHIWPIICGIATIVGLIVAFFPSVFNLEKKKIVEYSYSLNSLKDAQKLIDFLSKHQNSIVNLNITYTENERYRDAYDKYGNIIIDENADMDGTPKKEDLNKLSTELEGKISYGAVDSNGNIFIKSEFKFLPFLNNFNFLRKNGEIGIWIPGKKEDGSDDINYRIVIKEESKDNSSFKWSIKDRNKDSKEMQLTGIFFVKKFIDVHDSDYGSDKATSQTIATMSPQWKERYSGLDQIGLDNMTVIELLPLSDKEIESRNY